MATKTILDSTLTAIANAIRGKTGESGTMTPLQMPAEISSIPDMNPVLEALICGTASGDVDITLPEYSYALSLAFGDDNSVIKRNNSAVTGLTIRGVAFLGNRNLTTAGNGGLFFSTNHRNLKYIRLPDCVELQLIKSNIYANAFQNLEEFTAPKLEYMTSQMRLFGGYNATKLKSFVCPLYTSQVHNAMFYYCNELELVDVKSGSIANDAMNSCSALTALVLRSSTMCSLVATSALASTPIESGTGYIYVPRNLISTYEAATNWSTYAGQFRALEDYTDDGTITGEFIMPTA